jgi:hypothetical protein
LDSVVRVDGNAVILSAQGSFRDARFNRASAVADHH